MLRCCDEYPFASTQPGGQFNFDLGKVSLRLVSRAEQSLQGGLLKWFNDSAGNVPAAGVAFISLAIPFLPSFAVDSDEKVHAWK